MISTVQLATMLSGDAQPRRGRALLAAAADIHRVARAEWPGRPGDVGAPILPTCPSEVMGSELWSYDDAELIVRRVLIFRRARRRRSPRDGEV